MIESNKKPYFLVKRNQKKKKKKKIKTSMELTKKS